MKIIYTLIILTLFDILPVHAQSWKEINPPPNIFNGSINSLVTDKDGNVYAAGNFKNLSNEYVVARWNGSWSELKNGNNALKANNVINCMVVDKSGNIYAAGGFTNSLGQYYVAKWNGISWSQLGTGANGLNLNGMIYSMTVDATGNIYIAGGFRNSSGKLYVMKWNGSNWTELGNSSNALNANGFIYSLTADSSGNIYAAGHFTNSSNKYYVAKWNGTGWTELGAATPLNANDYINSIKSDHAGNIYAAGAFRNSSGEYYVARWDGNSWTEIGSGINAIHANGPINNLAINAAGDIYAAGFGTNLSGNTNLVKWNGTSWNELFNVGYLSNNSIRTISLDDIGNVYAGGDFQNVGRHHYVAKWNGTTMKELGRQGEILHGHNGIHHVTADIYGNVYAVGNFWSTPGVKDLAKWDGIGWTWHNQSNTITFGEVETIATDNLGNVYINGVVTMTGKVCVAKWNGTTWIEVTNPATPLNATAPISWLASDSNNNIYATGTFIDNGIIYSIAKWNGTTWTKFGSAPGAITRLVAGTGDSVYVTGFFTNANGKHYVAKVEGNTWTELGTGTNALNANSYINSIVTDRAGNLYAAGRFTNSNFNAYVARWNGTNWTEVGTIPKASYITSLAADSSGNIFAAVSSNSNSEFYILKWNGSNWSELGGAGSLNANSVIYSIYKDKNENIYATGLFSNNTSNYIAAYGKSLLILQQPALVQLPNEYCSSSGQQTLRILNFPDNSKISVIASLDNIRLNMNPDSTFSFDPSLLTPGHHLIKISFSIGVDSMQTTKEFIVFAAATPDVQISANTTLSTNSNPVIITAVNSTGGGTNPLYTFAKDRMITTILQAESANNILNLNPVTLSSGDNWIYVKMKTSESCYSVQTNIDSINIVRSVTTSITDVDFPGQQINIYPLPFDQSFTIDGLQVTKAYSISAVNSVGQVVFQKNIERVSNLKGKLLVPAGVYWLHIYDRSKKRFIGIIKMLKQ